MHLASGPGGGGGGGRRRGGGALRSRLLLQLLVVVVALPAVVKPGPVRTRSYSRYANEEERRPGDEDNFIPGRGAPPEPLDYEASNELPIPLPLPNEGKPGLEDNSSANYNPLGINNDAIKFMQNFGYMIKPDNETEFLYTPEAFTEAVKEMQKFGGIPETGVIDNSTLELMTTPRCGRPDKDPASGLGGRTKRYILGSEGWKKRRLSYYLANWSPKLYSKEKTMVELRKAFDVWSVYSNLKFIESETPDADIVIFFANYDHYDGYPFDGTGGILAHAYYPYEFGHYGGDVHFDDHEGWAIRPQDEHSGEVDFFMVAVHEIGHSLGLAHSPVSGSIMFPYYKGYQPNFALDYDDIMAMWKLYISRRLEGDDEFFNTTSTSTTTTTTTPSTPTDDDQAEGDGVSGKDPVIHVDEYDYNNDGEANDTDTYEDDGIKYHGDYETVDDHLRRVGATDSVPDLPSLPTLPPEGDGVSSSGGQGGGEGGQGGSRGGEEEDIYEADNRRREEEERKREEEKKRRREEEAERKRWEEERRRKEAERRRTEEEERRRWEEKVRRHEEEYEKRRREENSRTTTTTTTTTTTKPPEVIPNICEGNFDAVALLRQELFVFKGKYVWRFRRPGQLESGYPTKFHHMFTALPRYIQRVDAAYERSDGKIVFFVGKYYYVHDGDYVVDVKPLPITNYGLPEALTQLDAVMVWAKNQKIYFFSRNLYWRYNETTQRMDDYYPRDISRWNGVPSEIDGAFTWTDGTTHFFKGKNYWQFDNARVRPMEGYPQEATRYWTGCYSKSYYARRDP
ncbi:matrix metalloproteinase-17-like isoform X2 [Oratosquilla oratoria]